MATNHMPYPGFVKLLYHSPFSPHVMIIPTRQWLPPSAGHPSGFFSDWDSTTQDAAVMIQNLVTLLAANFQSNVVFDRAEIWTKASPTAIPVLVYGFDVTTPGTGTVTGWQEATQLTIFMRDAANGAFKIVLLDYTSDNQFGKYYDPTSNPAANAVVAEVSSPTNGWQSRAGGRPQFFRAYTVTLNNRLRREYHLR